MSLTLFCKHSDIIAVLRSELEYFKAQFEHERQRAENAIQELLQVRAGVSTVIAQPTPREAMQRETLIDRLLKDSEFNATGEVDVE